MFARSLRSSSMRVVRSMSGLAETSPAAAIAKNAAVLQSMSAASDEAGLEAAKNVTVEAAPVAAATAAGAAFQADPTAWQNMAMGDYIATEAGRSDFYPFLIGGLVTYLLLGVMLPASLPSEGKKSSKYIKMINGDHSH